MIALILMILALVAFLIAAFGVATPRLSLDWTAVGLAFVGAAWLVTHVTHVAA